MKALVEARFPSSCQMSHVFSCPCLFALQHKPRQKEFFRTLQGWQRVDEEIVSFNKLQVAYHIIKYLWLLDFLGIVLLFVTIILRYDD